MFHSKQKQSKKVVNIEYVVRELILATRFVKMSREALSCKTHSKVVSLVSIF